MEAVAVDGVGFGPDYAWDALCEAQDERLRKLREENPGCASCRWGIPCPCGCGYVWCVVDEDFARGGNPPCDYEEYE